MSAPAIRIQALGKQYVLGNFGGGSNYRTFRESLVEGARLRLGQLSGRARPPESRQEFWALRHVTFEVARGEVVGIIGRNGAGKSTLLKILSRITAPTEGRVEIRGRIASLLEVGTGFHPELTGRENIRLNGAILGMSSREIAAKFESIVDFAGVEKFIDTPVKRYSSGMQVRLAFAVAAHLDPEILIVDEVLAVGDAEFQKKCLGKLQELTNSQQRTVLFVSHNMAAVKSLCGRAVLLQDGRIKSAGPADEIVGQYSSADEQQSSYIRRAMHSASDIFIHRASIQSHVIREARLRVDLHVMSPGPHTVIINFRILDSLSHPVAMATLGGLEPGSRVELQSGSTELHADIALSGLASGVYKLSIDIEEPYNQFYERLEEHIAFIYEAASDKRQVRAMHQSWNSGYFLLKALLINKSESELK